MKAARIATDVFYDPGRLHRFAPQLPDGAEHFFWEVVGSEVEFSL